MTDWQNDKLIYGEECELPPESWMRILRPGIVVFSFNSAAVARIYQKYIKFAIVSKHTQMRAHEKRSEHSKECQLIKHLLSLPIFTLTHGYAKVQSRHRIFIIGRDREWRDTIKSAVAMWFFCLQFLPPILKPASISISFSWHFAINLTWISHLFLFFLLSVFFSADHGKIIKAVNAESADSNKKVNSVVIEELDVLPTNEPIRNLEIIRTTQYGEYERSGGDDKKMASGRFEVYRRKKYISEIYTPHPTDTCSKSFLIE